MNKVQAKSKCYYGQYFELGKKIGSFGFSVKKPEKKAKKLGSFGKLIHDIANFKFLIIEKVLQASYIFATAAVVLMGFFFSSFSLNNQLNNVKS